jgi:hypothetical protein
MGKKDSIPADIFARSVETSSCLLLNLRKGGPFSLSLMT